MYIISDGIAHLAKNGNMEETVCGMHIDNRERFGSYDSLCLECQSISNGGKPVNRIFQGLRREGIKCIG